MLEREAAFLDYQSGKVNSLPHEMVSFVRIDE